MSEANMSYEQFAEKFGITFTWSNRSSNPDMPDRDMDHYLVTIGRGDCVMSLPFSKGRGNNGEPPTLVQVLECLASDSSGIKNARDFEDWASDYDYDTDSRKAEKTYNACKRNAEELETVLGPEAFEQLLWHTSDEYFLSDDDDADEAQEPSPGV